MDLKIYYYKIDNNLILVNRWGFTARTAKYKIQLLRNMKPSNTRNFIIISPSRNKINIILANASI